MIHFGQLIEQVEAETLHHLDLNVRRQGQRLQDPSDLRTDSIVRRAFISETKDECSHAFSYTTLFLFVG